MRNILFSGFPIMLAALFVAGCSRPVSLSSGSGVLSNSRASVKVEGNAGGETDTVREAASGSESASANAEGVETGAAGRDQQTTASVGVSLPEEGPGQAGAGTTSAQKENAACLELRKGENSSKNPNEDDACDVTKQHGKGLREAGGDTGDESDKLQKKEQKINRTFGNDEESLGLCAEHFQKKVLDMKISASLNKVQVEGKDVMAFKITGNQNQLDVGYVKSPSAEGMTAKPEFEGLCVFAAGNKSIVNVSVKDVLIKKIVFVGRGNLADFNVVIEGSGDAGEIVFDGKGHEPSLEITAPESFPCNDRVANVGKLSAVCKVAK